VHCVFCGGKLEEKRVIFTYEKDYKYLFVKMFLLPFALNVEKRPILLRLQINC